MSTRRTSLSLAVRAALFAAAPLAATGAQAATECADLAHLEWPDTTITLAERVPAGEFEMPGPPSPFGPPGPRTVDVPSMCRVAGTVAPAIRFEVWMPEGSAWNGRFQAVGGGALAGAISYPAMGDAIRDGYATASTDTGHESSDEEWLGDRGRLIDYGYRAIHEMTVKAKALIDAHYGESAQYSYFNGCSTGGRQGLMEAQRFPDDYDGIIAGAPVFDFTHLHIGQLWTAHATLKTPGAVLDNDDLALVQTAVLAMCDANDGVEDGILTDPRTCDFDPTSLQCGTGSDDACLAAEQVRALQMIYQGPVNPRTGVSIYPGLEPGGEAGGTATTESPRGEAGAPATAEAPRGEAATASAGDAGPPGRGSTDAGGDATDDSDEAPRRPRPGWAMIMDGEDAFFMDTALLNGMTFENADYDWRTFDFDGDMDLVNAKLAHVLNAVDPDLREFRENGGKLIMYHGWNDPGVMPQRTIDYYDAVVEFAGKATGGDGHAFADEYVRLFMMPGMGHCRGGPGPDQVDFVGALSAWVEHDEAPERLLARSERDGETAMTRPLCPHPQVARYDGGDPNDAANFSCAAP